MHVVKQYLESGFTGLFNLFSVFGLHDVILLI
jgi:hypothetical protein